MVKKILRLLAVAQNDNIISPARHSERTHLCGSEESHCATGCKFKFHRHEKILRYTQNDIEKKNRF
ncbi:MAG: hypothetical protein N4A43_00685 [Alphaproteobacteria bacterium]|nr:hypothetical protein [Alphaproteobacteria bacterium]